jgi:AcrR family transcriptional regulator
MPTDRGVEPSIVSESGARLLDAARELFYSQGARATTVRQITSACGLTPGAFYNHFESKEELLYYLVSASHIGLEQNVLVAQASADGPRAELDAIVRVYVENHARNRKGARIASRDYIVLTGRLYEEIVAIRRRLRERVVEVLERGAHQGVFRLPPGETSATLTSVAVLDMCIQVSEWYHEDHGLDPNQLADHYIHLARRLVGAQDLVGGLTDGLAARANTP